jgi:hypothetical protein
VNRNAGEEEISALYIKKGNLKRRAEGVNESQIKRKCRKKKEDQYSETNVMHFYSFH